jgi:hypothetical protein
MSRFLALPLGDQSKKKILWDNVLRLYARKDLGLALDLARATEVPMRLGALCEQEMIEAMARAWRTGTARSSSRSRRSGRGSKCACRLWSPRSDLDASWHKGLTVLGIGPGGSR